MRGPQGDTPPHRVGAEQAPGKGGGPFPTAVAAHGRPVMRKATLPRPKPGATEPDCPRVIKQGTGTTGPSLGGGAPASSVQSPLSHTGSGAGGLGSCAFLCKAAAGRAPPTPAHAGPCGRRAVRTLVSAGPPPARALFSRPTQRARPRAGPRDPRPTATRSQGPARGSLSFLTQGRGNQGSGRLRNVPSRRCSPVRAAH